MERLINEMKDELDTVEGNPYRNREAGRYSLFSVFDFIHAYHNCKIEKVV